MKRSLFEGLKKALLVIPEKAGLRKAGRCALAGGIPGPPKHGFYSKKQKWIGRNRISNKRNSCPVTYSIC